MPKIEGQQGQTVFAWEVAESHQALRSRRWYIVSALIALGLLVYAIWTFNFLFALIIVLTSLIIAADQLRGNKQTNFAITTNGITVDDHFYPYHEINNFWIIYQPPEAKYLYFDYKSKFRPKLMIPLENQNPVAIREFLLTYLFEDLAREHELFSDAVSRVLRL